MKPTPYIISIVTFIKNEKIEKLKQEMIDKFESNYGNKSHLTFLMLPIDPEVVDQFIAGKTDLGKIPNILKSCKHDSVRVDKIKYFKERKFISLEIIKDKEMHDFHYALLNEVNKLRNNYVRAKDLEKYHNETKLNNSKNYSNEEIENIKKYGYHRVANQFRPHITVGSFENTDDNLVINKFLDKVEKKLSDLILFKFNSIHIDIVKENGENQLEMERVFRKTINL